MSLLECKLDQILKRVYVHCVCICASHPPSNTDPPCTPSSCSNDAFAFHIIYVCLFHCFLVYTLSRAGSWFSGFLLQARYAATTNLIDTSAIGEFSKTPDTNENTIFLDCANTTNSAVTQSKKLIFQYNFRFYWTPPPDLRDGESVQFV